MVFKQTFILTPLAPFSLALSAQIFTGLNGQVRSYADGVYSQVLHVDGMLVLAKITQHGTIQKPELTIELTSNQPITSKTLTCAQKTIEYIFNLNLDLKEFYRHTEKDTTMHKITQALCGFKYPTTPTAFESLVGFDCGAADFHKNRPNHRGTVGTEIRRQTTTRQRMLLCLSHHHKTSMLPA